MLEIAHFRNIVEVAACSIFTVTNLNKGRSKFIMHQYQQNIEDKINKSSGNKESIKMKTKTNKKTNYQQMTRVQFKSV